MKNNYSIEEILSAVDDLQKIKKQKNLLNLNEKNKPIEKTGIPKNTLKLIEEAEGSKNQFRLQISLLINLLAKSCPSMFQCPSPSFELLKP